MKNYFSKIKKIPVLTREEERNLLIKAKEGDERAREKLITSNLKFVVSIAKKYQGQGLALEDLIGEGNLGLCTALEKFDLDKDNKFITYAVWWIRHFILQALSRASSGAIRLPSNKQQVLIKVNKCKDKLEQQLGRKPTAEEISDFLGIEIDENYTEYPSYISLDVSYVEDGASLLDILAEEKNDPDLQLIENILVSAVEQLLNSIEDERERAILKYYHGIGVVRTHTLEEIGGLFSISRERIRQIKESIYNEIANNEKYSHLLNHIK